MPRPDTDRLVVGKEALDVAKDIVARGYIWSQGYLESFAERVDALRGTEHEAVYRAGSKRILEILKQVPKADYGHGVWKELGLDPDHREEITECCNGIIGALC